MDHGNKLEHYGKITAATGIHRENPRQAERKGRKSSDEVKKTLEDVGAARVSRSDDQSTRAVIGQSWGIIGTHLSEMCTR